MKRSIYPIILLVCLLGTLVLMSGCKEEPKPAAPPTYKVQQIKTATGEMKMDFPTTIESSQVVEVRPRVEGYLDKIYIDEGARVKKGEPMFLINQDDFRQKVLAANAEVMVAESNIFNAELEIEKLTPLVEQNIISEFQLRTAESNLRAAQAKLEQAKANQSHANINMGYTLIKAPATGVVSQINLREGALIHVSDPAPLTTISADGNVFAYFSISEHIITLQRDSSILEKLPEAQLRLNSGAIYEEKGKLELASGLVDRQTGSLLLKAVFPNSNNRLRTGLSGSIIIPITIPDAILIPKAATYETLNKTMVVTVDSENKTLSKEIKILGSDGENYIISDGVKAGDVIVIEGVRKLHDGMEITTKN